MFTLKPQNLKDDSKKFLFLLSFNFFNIYKFKIQIIY